MCRSTMYVCVYVCPGCVATLPAAPLCAPLGPLRWAQKAPPRRARWWRSRRMRRQTLLYGSVGTRSYLLDFLFDICYIICYKPSHRYTFSLSVFLIKANCYGQLDLELLATSTGKSSIPATTHWVLGEKYVSYRREYVCVLLCLDLCCGWGVFFQAAFHRTTTTLCIGLARKCLVRFSRYAVKGCFTVRFLSNF